MGGKAGRWLTIEEVAERLNFTTDKVRRIIGRRDIEFLMDERTYRISEAALADYIARKTWKPKRGSVGKGEGQ